MRWFISTRYFFSHKRQSLVCIAGVTISVTMFIAMLSMMNGFSDKFIMETVEASGHVTVHDEPRERETQILERFTPDPDALLAISRTKPRENVKQIKNPTGLIAQLRRMPGIVAAAPEVTGEAIASYGTKNVNLQIVGIEPEQQQRVTTIGNDLMEGDFTRLRTTADGVVVGSGIMKVLGAKLDDTVVLTSNTGGRTSGRIVGVFETGVTPVDYSRAYMLVNSAQTLLDKKNIINRIILRTDDYEQAEAYAAQIESICGYRTESWQEASANFLKIFKVQTVITYVITGALLIVAAFGVLNIMIMAVLERVNDIAILKSFGLSRWDVTLVYLWQGMVIGLIGAVMGVAMGKLVVEGLRRLPIKVEGLVKSEGLLMSENVSMYVQAFVASVLITIVAAAYPARRAATYDPVEVIRGAH
jgi:lipoprotein-releasing system permease protein